MAKTTNSAVSEYDGLLAQKNKKSFKATAQVYLPLYLVIRRTDGGIFDGISRRSRGLSGFLGALFSVYLLFSAADTGLRAHYYTSSTIFDSAPSLYFYVFIGAALLFAV